MPDLSHRFLAAALAAAFLCPPAAAGEAPANALLAVPAETAFDRKFQDFLDKRGAKLLESHPPSVFIGHIPAELDKELERRFGARVYRDKVDDWAGFARYGEKAVFAVNAWNKRFLADPPAAPLVVSAEVLQSGRRQKGLKLAWNEVMKASAYRLQIAPSADFSAPAIDTLAPRNEYTLYPVLLPDGVYYWRVAPVVTLNTGETAEQAFSAPYSFAVSVPARGKARRARPLPGPASPLRDGLLRWQDAPGDRYFRLQLSDRPTFEAPLADVFTDTCAYRVDGLPLNPAAKYYLRVMSSDGRTAGDWSEPSEVTPEAGAPAKRRGRREK